MDFVYHQSKIGLCFWACNIQIFFGDFPVCVHISWVKVDSAHHLGMSVVIYFCTPYPLYVSLLCDFALPWALA
jgi:hypothetical protein